MKGPLAVLRAPRLAAQASHEVRGPLTVASLMLDGMVDRGVLDPDAARALDLQLRRARLAVDDLAASTRGTRAPDRVEPVEAAALVEQVASAWDVDVVPPDDDAIVVVDRTRIAQAVGNLLANALEHGSGPVELRGRVGAGVLRIEVRDRGAGLSAPIRVLSRRRRRGRRGHGLAIAADIAERHGGRLVAAPSAGGAVVAVELPIRGVAR